MAHFGKEPNIKLIPSDPMTNTILIIYCVSSKGASVPYKAVWRRINPKRNKIEQIKYHNGSSYRCSPLDIDYFIEVTIYFQHQNAQVSRIVQSNIVKVSRQLKQKRMLLKEPIVARVFVQEISLQMKLFVKDQTFNMMPINPSFQSLNFAIPISDIITETQGNQMTFKVTFRQKFDQFLNFATPLIGSKPRISNNEIICEFGSDINRDIILLQIAEVLQRSFKPQFSVLHFPTTRSIKAHEQNGKKTARQMENKIAKSPNKSQASVSPTSGYKDKFQKIGKYHGMKNSFTGGTNNQKKSEIDFQTPTTPNIMSDYQNQKKERQYLNVFEDEDLQFLNSPIPAIPSASFAPKTTQPKVPIQNDNGNDGPSINLRGSFEQLQKSFNSNLNQQSIDRAFSIQSNDINKKMQEELDKFKFQNIQLKKQLETVAQLTKQNNSIKRKYLQMKEQVHRLQLQRKVILTDKIRCQVNYHKQIQEKQTLKKELEHLRQIVRPNAAHMERSLRVNSFHQPAKFDRHIDNRQPREMSRSPNTSYHH